MVNQNKILIFEENIILKNVSVMKKNSFILFLIFCTTVLQASAQPRVDYTTTAKIIKTSPLATNFINWQYNEYYLKWTGYLNDNSICTNIKDRKNIIRTSPKAQSFDENIQSFRIRKIKYNDNYWYLLSITSYEGAYDYPLIHKDWKFWKTTNLYILYPDQYLKLLNLQNNNNDIIIYNAGSFLTNSTENTLETSIALIFRNNQIEYTPTCLHLYIRVEDSKTIRLLLPTQKALGTSRNLNFHKYYFEIPKSDFEKVINFDKWTPAPIKIQTPNPKSICDINNYKTYSEAHFIGGINNMQTYIKCNQRYPINSYNNQIEGTVIVSAKVDHAGALHDIKIKQSINPELDKEAIRIVTYMPRWEPAKEEGVSIASIVEIPITFKLNDFLDK